MKSFWVATRASISVPEWLSIKHVLLVMLLSIFAFALVQISNMENGFTQAYALEYFTRAEWQLGMLPAWNSYLLAGYPQLANPQTMAFYPPAILLRFFPLNYAFGLQISLHLWWASLGVLILLRSQKLKLSSSFLGALLWMFTSIGVTYLIDGQLATLYTLTWLAWVVWVWMKAFTEDSWWGVVSAGLFTGVMFLAGGSQVFLVVQGLLFFLGIIWLNNKHKQQEFSVMRIGLRLLLGMIIAFGAAASQWLPTLEFYRLARRVTLECASPFSLIRQTDKLAEVLNLNAWEGRVLTESAPYALNTLLTRTANAQGYAPLMIESYANFTRGAEPLGRCPELGFADIDKQDTQLLRLLSVNFITAIGQQSVTVLQPYPRMALVSEVLSVPSSLEAIKLARMADYDPTQKIYIEGVPSQKLPQGETRIRVTQYGADSFTVLLDTTEESWFYINDVWYPGWKAWVNGAERKVYRANGTFRAVFVPKGQSTLFMQYESTYLGLGMWIGGVTWGTLLILWLWHWQVFQKTWRAVAWYYDRVLGEDD